MSPDEVHSTSRGGPSSLRSSRSLRCRAIRRASSFRRALASGFSAAGGDVGRLPEEFDGGRTVRADVELRPARRAESGSVNVSAKRAFTKSRMAGTLRKFSDSASRPCAGNRFAVVLEEVGPGTPEAVDRLLEVADQEQLAVEQGRARRGIRGSQPGSGRCPGIRPPRPGRSTPRATRGRLPNDRRAGRGSSSSRSSLSTPPRDRLTRS